MKILYKKQYKTLLYIILLVDGDPPPRRRLRPPRREATRTRAQGRGREKNDEKTRSPSPLPFWRETVVRRTTRALCGCGRANFADADYSMLHKQKQPFLALILSFPLLSLNLANSLP